MTFIPPTSEGPTIEKLESRKSTENLTGAPLARSKTLFGKSYYFYEDNSVLIEDPEKQEYHFLTEGGREKGRMLREATRTILDDDAELEKMRELGQGKGGFSTVYELETPEGSIAIKTTNSAGYYLKEHSEEIASKAESPQFGRVFSSRKTVQKMSLADTLELFKELDKAGIRRPEFYGFSVKRSPENGKLQEIQVMEKISKPTIESILQFANEQETQVGAESQYQYKIFLEELANKYFEGNCDTLIKKIVADFFAFVRNVKNEIYGISDLEADNIFLVGYDGDTEEFEFMVIDPIREESYIKTIEKKPASLINGIKDENKQELNKNLLFLKENYNFPNK